MNYQSELDKIIKNLKEKPKLLLHACCGPCSSYVIEYLSSFFEITILYYNPNIYPKEEYKRRLNELKDFLLRFLPAIKNKIDLVELNYDPKEFIKAIKIEDEPEIANCPEKGERCRRCYEFRLKETYEYALKNNFDYFCTTLSISPFKDSNKINKEGEKISEKISDGPKWLYSDFKKKNGFLKSLEISQEYNLYRQQYCGCIFSANKNNNN